MVLTERERLVAAVLGPVAGLLEGGATREGARAVAYVAEVLRQLAAWMYVASGVRYDEAGDEARQDEPRVTGDVDVMIEVAMSREAGMPMPPAEGA